MTEEEVTETTTSDEADSVSEEEEVMVTVWSPEPSETIELNDTPVDEWVRSIDFKTTEDVPIPERLVDQVIGQEAGSVVIRKAAEQRRHMMMIGDPGTGKSMLARSMTELLPQDKLEDIYVTQTMMMKMSQGLEQSPLAEAIALLRARKRLSEFSEKRVRKC